jgi:hypothetical protein
LFRQVLSEREELTCSAHVAFYPHHSSRHWSIVFLGHVIFLT